MKFKIFVLLIFFSSSNTFAQSYIRNYSFEKEHEKEILSDDPKLVNNHEWFLKQKNYGDIKISSHSQVFINNDTTLKSNTTYLSALIVTPACEGYNYTSLKDNFSIHVKLTKLIRKGSKYRLEYFLNKSFMANSANKYFYMSLLLSQKEPSLKENNKTQFVPNRILHSDIKISKSVVYKFEKNKIDTIRVEPRPDLWQKFSIEFVAEDDFEFLGLQRNITHPQGLTEFMYLDNVQLYLIEDNTSENKELAGKIDNLAKQIQFETGSAQLTPQSKIVLDSLSFYLENINKSNSDVFVEINGHTDNEGDAKANVLLSKQRAETVKSFIEKKSDKENQLQFLTKGFGNTEPLVSNATEEGKATNRRVEIKLIGKDTVKNIIFESLSFEEAKQKAKKENKLIFIDAYTTWCKPCKLMDRDVFTDSTVAKVFNESFINLKIDMESEMGKPLNAKYKIEGYPTFLVVDFEGNLKYMKAGFLNAVELTNFGREVEQLKNEKSQESTTDILNKRLYEKAKIEYKKNPCDLEVTEGYFNLIDKQEKEELQSLQSDYINCIKSNQDFSSDKVSFLVTNLIASREDIAYNFYINNKSKFEKNYGDSLLVLESYLEETFFLQETDTLKSKVSSREKLTQEEIEEYEKIVARYADFSEKIEKESKEKGFERPIKGGFVDYIIYSTAIQFYAQHNQQDKYSEYLINYNQLEKLESYKNDFFGDMTIPLRNFGIYTLHYLATENKEKEVLKELSLIWKDLIDKNYLSNYDSYFIAARVFYSNKEKQEAQKTLQKAFELKDESFDEEKYKELKTQINQL